MALPSVHTGAISPAHVGLDLSAHPLGPPDGAAPPAGGAPYVLVDPSNPPGAPPPAGAFSPTHFPVLTSRSFLAALRQF